VQNFLKVGYYYGNKLEKSFAFDNGKYLLGLQHLQSQACLLGSHLLAVGMVNQSFGMLDPVKAALSFDADIVLVT